MSKRQPVRAGQLITQYGVGSTFVDRNGISYIVAGTDAWFPGDIMSGGKDLGEDRSFDEAEFIIREARLETRLEVSGFRMPPEFREPRRGVQIPNTGLTIPVLRFPQWHFCSRCGTMEFFPLTQTGRVFCRSCFQEKNLKFELSQMQFVANCERGHLQDFPYREWVHRAHQPQCTGSLSYRSSGGGTLAAQKITCDCGVTRSLMNIDKAGMSETFLSFNLTRTGGLYMCQGHRPWLAETTNTTCSAYLRGNQRNAKNVYFPQVIGAIGLPENISRADELQHFLLKPEVADKLPLLKSRGETETVNLLKIFYPGFLKAYSDEEIERGLAHLNSGVRPVRIAHEPGQKAATGNFNNTNCLSLMDDAPEISETEFRHDEFQVLREAQDSETLLSRRMPVTAGNSLLTKAFSRVLQIHRLRETRVNTGFSRIYSDSVPSIDDRKKMMRRDADHSRSASINDDYETDYSQDWLPAVTVYGEGIFLEINEDRLKAWEKKYNSRLRRHLTPIIENSAVLRRSQSESAAQTINEMINPRYVLAHTLAHLLIRELDFESGYSASAIRERLYVSQNKLTPMNGLLIYTTDGDSAGTLGGLVRLGTPEYLEKLLARAINSARWCGSDPGCAEVGVSYGQGPGNQNLAACHGCALVSETSCERFNKFLDRALLINLPGTSEIGYFDF